MPEPTVEEMLSDLQVADAAGDKVLAGKIAEKIKSAQQKATANVPVSMMTGDPETDRRIGESLRSGGDVAPITKSAALRAGAIALPAALGMGPVTGGMLSGALEGLASRKEGEPLSDTALGVAGHAALGGTTGLALKGVGKLIGGALPRAHRMTVKLLQPTSNELQKLEKDFGSWEAAGETIYRTGAAKPGLSMRDRRDIIKTVGDAGKQAVGHDIAAAAQKGATPDMAALAKELTGAIDDVFPPGSTTAPTFSGGRSTAEAHALDVLTNPGQTKVPLLQYLENAKRAASTEGYLKAGQYADPNAGAKDPARMYFRRARGAMREASENAIRQVDPDLADKFIEDKARAAVGKAFEPIATRAANVAEASGGSAAIPEKAWSLKSAITHSIYDPIMSSLRPRLIPLNMSMSKLNVMPQRAKQFVSSVPGAAMSGPGLTSDVEELIRLLRAKEE